MGEPIIKFENVSKQYRLGAIGGGTLKGDLQSWAARIRGKEDPNAAIGAKSGKKNERFMALENISFEVYKGERLGIIGHNGAGKSTLLKLLSRVTAPTSGTISYNGRIASMLEVGTGFHPELTGHENVYLNGAILGMTKSEIANKFDEIVEFAEMGQFIETPVKRYSSGMYVKLAFAVAAHLDSEILVMDEVLAVGDMKFQEKCLGKMGDVSKEDGRTVLYVSHNMNTIRQLCTRCIVLDHGKIVFDGDVDKAIDIYSDFTTLEMKKVWNHSQTQRKQRSNGYAKIETISILNESGPKLETGSHLIMEIECSFKRDVNSAYFRMAVLGLDDTALGLMKSEQVICGKQGESACFRFDADISTLAPGNYKFTSVLYDINEYGAFELIDHVCDSFIIEVLQAADFNNNISWNSKWWGHYMLPTMKLEHENND